MGPLRKFTCYDCHYFYIAIVPVFNVDESSKRSLLLNDFSFLPFMDRNTESHLQLYNNWRFVSLSTEHEVGYSCEKKWTSILFLNAPRIFILFGLKGTQSSSFAVEMVTKTHLSCLKVAHLVFVLQRIQKQARFEHWMVRCFLLWSLYGLDEGFTGSLYNVWRCTEVHFSLLAFAGKLLFRRNEHENALFGKTDTGIHSWFSGGPENPSFF